MSKALKCDRCGQCFDPYNMKDGQSFTTIPTYIFQTSENLANCEVEYRDENINYCPMCTESFTRWMSFYLVMDNDRKNSTSDNGKGGVQKPRGGFP